MKHSERFTNAVRIKGSDYFVNKLGDVFSNFNKSGRSKNPIRLLSQHIRNGYPSVRINLGDGIRHYTVHRLVASAFIENKSKLDQVNHINGIKTDNRVENLEWSNASLNMIHAYQNNLMISPCNRRGFTGDLSPTSKAVLKKTENGTVIKRYSSLSETSTDGYNPCSVSKNCKGITKKYKGHIFEFETENNQPKHNLETVLI